LVFFNKEATMNRKVFITIFTLVFLVALAPYSFAANAKLMSGENVLACVNFNDGVTSSDMTLIVQLEADGKILVNEGDAVKYLYASASPGADWMNSSFNDSSWTDGISGVGFADGDDNTTVPANVNPVIYTRYRFNVGDATAVTKLILRADYDDAYVAYLNGVEIARSASMALGGSVPGEVPPWNYSIDAGKVANHEATDLAAGKPNPARVYQDEFTIAFDAVGGTAVKSAGKLATTWGDIKATR
jgi:hypothetical protein